jgi:hypothetical protein
LQMKLPYALHGVSGLWLSSLSYLLIKAVSDSHHSHDTIMCAKIILSQSFLIETKSVWYPRTCIRCNRWCFNFSNKDVLLSIVLSTPIVFLDILQTMVKLQS